MSRGLTQNISIALLALLSATPVQAHALGAECKLVGNRVEVEAYYDDDAPARAARVRVEDGSPQRLAEGRTDAQGRWSFARPRAGRYTVVVDAGAGHRTQVSVTVPVEPANSAPVSAAVSSLADDSCCGEPTPTDAPPRPVSLGTGPDRQTFTSIPWLKLGLGLAVLGALTLAFLVRQGRASSGA